MVSVAYSCSQKIDSNSRCRRVQSIPRVRDGIFNTDNKTVLYGDVTSWYRPGEAEVALISPRDGGTCGGTVPMSC